MPKIKITFTRDCDVVFFTLPFGWVATRRNKGKVITLSDKDRYEIFDRHLTVFYLNGNAERILIHYIQIEFPDTESKPEPIMITVEGGVIQDIAFPPNCKTRIVVRDFDIEGSSEDALTVTERGEECLEMEYNPTN